jgi:hypothetical protein
MLVSTEEQLEVIREWHREDYDKLLLLCAEMGIDDGPSRFYDLSLALARKHHSAFQESPSLGKWTDIAGAYLVVEVERLTADQKPGHGELWACYQLIKRSEWRRFLGMGDDPNEPQTKDSGEALRRQYQRFKKHPLADAARNAYKLHEMQDNIREWEIDLKEVLRNPHP